MKNFFKMAVVAIALSMTALVANAQVKGDMAAGAKFAFSTGDGWSNIGIGAKFQYNVMDPLRLEAQFTYFMPKKDGTFGAESKINMWEGGVNAHWLFRLGDKVNLYPLAGLGLLGVKTKVDFGEWGDLIGAAGGSAGASDFALSLGGGVDFKLSQSFFLNAEAKYLVAGGGRLVLSAGANFMF